MHTSQVLKIANIMTRNETWLYNTKGFIQYTSWIYDRNVKGFCTEVKATCLEESKVG
jgi:hypothetical protein